MAEENQNEEQSTFKVADRRKFNFDGSLREGVTLEEDKPKTEAPRPPASAASVVSEDRQTLISAAETSESFAAPSDAEPSADFASSSSFEAESDDQEVDEMQIPGADNPASFANFVLSLASQAAAALGMAESPVGGQVRVDLQSGKYLIDVLGMLRDKTKGNLHPQEQKLFDQLLGELRMQYVQIARVAQAQAKRQEDQLMKQAAQKFTGKDILGR